MLQINIMAKPCQKPRKLEKPGSRLPRACKVPDAEWTKFRRIIEDLYARTDLKTVMATMTSEHGFDARCVFLAGSHACNHRRMESKKSYLT